MVFIKPVKLRIKDLLASTGNYGNFFFENISFQEVYVIGSVTYQQTLHVRKDNVDFFLATIDDGTGVITGTLLIDKEPRFQPFGTSEDVKHGETGRSRLRALLEEKEKNQNNVKDLKNGNDVCIWGRLKEERGVRYVKIEKIEKLGNLETKMENTNEIIKFYKHVVFNKNLKIVKKKRSKSC